MALDARTTRPRRVLHLGDFGLEVLAPVLGAAISAGGTVGSAYILSSGQQDVAKTQAKTNLQIALDQDRIALETARLAAGNTSQETAVASQAVSTGGVVLALALFAGFVFGGNS